MKQSHRMILSELAAGVLLTLGGCSGMSAQDKSTAVGAGVGAVGGAILDRGDKRRK